jgi:hypothetical protein
MSAIRDWSSGGTTSDGWEILSDKFANPAAWRFHATFMRRDNILRLVYTQDEAYTARRSRVVIEEATSLRQLAEKLFVRLPSMDKLGEEMVFAAIAQGIAANDELRNQLIVDPIPRIDPDLDEWAVQKLEGRKAFDSVFSTEAKASSFLDSEETRKYSGFVGLSHWQEGTGPIYLRANGEKYGYLTDYWKFVPARGQRMNFHCA